MPSQAAIARYFDQLAHNIEHDPNPAPIKGLRPTKRDFENAKIRARTFREAADIIRRTHRRNKLP